MKKVLPIALLLLVCSAKAQTKSGKLFTKHSASKSAAAATPNPTYSFFTYTSQYQPISGTSVTNGTKWDEADFWIPIGFDFKIYNRQNDSIRVFGGSVFTFDDLNSFGAIAAAAPVYDDVCDRAWDPMNSVEGDTGGLSDISYTTTGIAGQRICKIQISNAGFFGEIDSSSVSSSFINYQVWLYETSNVIEYHFGNSSILNAGTNLNNGNSGFTCGLANITNVVNFAGTGNMLKGSFNAPVMVGVDINNPFADAVSPQIQSGRVYQFNNTSAITAGIINNTANAEFKIYPNPATDKVFIQGDLSETGNLMVELYDLAGRKVYAQAGINSINLEGFDAGIYQLKILNPAKGEVFNHKLLIGNLR